MGSVRYHSRKPLRCIQSYCIQITMDIIQRFAFQCIGLRCMNVIWNAHHSVLYRTNMDERYVTLWGKIFEFLHFGIFLFSFYYVCIVNRSLIFILSQIKNQDFSLKNNIRTFLDETSNANINPFFQYQHLVSIKNGPEDSLRIFPIRMNCAFKLKDVNYRLKSTMHSNWLLSQPNCWCQPKILNVINVFNWVGHGHGHLKRTNLSKSTISCCKWYNCNENPLLLFAVRWYYGLDLDHGDCDSKIEQKQPENIHISLPVFFLDGQKLSRC